MNLIDTLNFGVAILAGALLGLFFFAGLWWTVRQLGSSQYVALLFLCSMLVRTAVVLVGFYYIVGDNWQHLLAGLFGFVMMRLLTIQYIRGRAQPRSMGKNSGYAP